MRKVAICKARQWEDEPEQIEDSDESNDEPTDDEEIIVISEEVDDTDIESESIEKTKDVDDKQESSTRLEKSDDERESSTRLESYDDKQESSTRLENVEDVQESSNWMDDMTTTRARPKRGSEVEFRKLHEDEIKFGRVKHVGKMGGKKKNTCWIVYKDGKEEELDFLKEVEGWKYTKPEQSVNFDHQTNFTVSETTGTDTFIEAEGVFHMTRNEPQEVLAAVVPASEYNHHEVQAAMKEELEKWIKFGAYEVHEDIGQERIDTRWMILRKETHDGLKVNVKARLCLRGFKETEKPRSDSPTVDRISNKILYAIAGNEGWKIETIDVTSAFLQGEDIDREVFVTPPKEADMKGIIWKMVKSGYGLYDAGRKWWIKVIESMIKLGGRTLCGDESFVYYLRDGKLVGLVSIHVDDFQGTGNDWFFRQVMDELCKMFKISKREVEHFKYTGVNVSHDNGEIVIDQDDYKESLEEIHIEASEDNAKPLTKTQFKQFRGMSGKLNWLSEMTRPDISFNVLDMASHTRDATVGTIKELNKIIRKTKKINGKVRYGRIGDFKDLKVLAISDASYCKTEEKSKSIEGRIIFLSNLEESRVSPIMWKARTIATVCKSPKDAETRAIDKCAEDAIYIARCIQEIYTGKRGESQIRVDMCTDSKSLIDSLDSTKQVESKMLRPIIKYLKQMLDAKAIHSIRWVDTDICLADILTKNARACLADVVMKILETGNMVNLEKTEKAAMIQFRKNKEMSR